MSAVVSMKQVVKRSSRLKGNFTTKQPKSGAQQQCQKTTKLTWTVVQKHHLKLLLSCHTSITVITTKFHNIDSEKCYMSHLICVDYYQIGGKKTASLDSKRLQLSPNQVFKCSHEHVLNHQHRLDLLSMNVLDTHLWPTVSLVRIPHLYHSLPLSLPLFLSISHTHINMNASTQTETHADTPCLLSMISAERRWEVE